MINENVCELQLMLEIINTIGLTNINNITGILKRALPLDDTFLNNILPEPFQPTQALENSFEEIRINKEVYNIVALTVSLSFDMANPGIYPIPAYTIIKNGVWDKGEKVDTSMIGIALYLYDEKYQSREKLNYLHKMGLTNSILASYQLPKQFVNFMDYDKSTGFIKTMWSTGFGHTSKHKAFYSFEPRNKKAYALYNFLTLTSSATGDSKTFKPSEIYSDWQASGYGINVFSDLTSSGKPFCRTSRYYNEDRINNTWTFALIQGANWINNPLTFYNASGWGWQEQILDNNINRGSLEMSFNEQQTNAINQFRDESLAYQNLQLGYEEERDLLNLDAMRATNKFASGEGLDLQFGAMNRIGSGIGKFLDENLKIYDENSGFSLSSIEQQRNKLKREQDINERIAQNTYNRVNRPSRMMMYSQNQAQGSFDKSLNTLSLNKAGALISNSQFGAKIQYNAMKRGVAPTLMYPRSSGLNLFTKNSFFTIQTKLSDADLIRFDKFLSLYGYSDNDLITMNRFTSHTNYNYIECVVDAVYTTTQVPSYMIQLLKTVLAVGVRLWHKKPNPDDYLTNVKK